MVLAPYHQENIGRILAIENKLESLYLHNGRNPVVSYPDIAGASRTTLDIQAYSTFRVSY